LQLDPQALGNQGGRQTKYGQLPTDYIHKPHLACGSAQAQAPESQPLRLESRFDQHISGYMPTTLCKQIGKHLLARHDPRSFRSAAAQEQRVENIRGDQFDWIDNFS
jgi:L-lysine 2,3-aminomutase